MTRQDAIALSIVSVMLDEDQSKSSYTDIFALNELRLKKLHDNVFRKLRNEHWQIGEEQHRQSFEATTDCPPEEALQGKGDMGFSGSVSAPVTML